MEEELPRRGNVDKKAAEEIVTWIDSILGERIDGDLIEHLKDGVILCRIADKAKPGSVRFKVSKMPFVQMENIVAFLRAASQAGVPDDELFETVDLFESRDPIQVVTTIRAYSRCANKLNPSIPVLGPQIAEKQNTGPRVFNPVQIPAWNTHQYGYMGGANQSTEGVTMGRRREITTPSPSMNKPPARSPNIFVPSRPPKPASLASKKIGKPADSQN